MFCGWRRGHTLPARQNSTPDITNRPQRSKVDIFVHFSEFKNVHPEETNIGDTMEFYLKEGGSKKDKAVFAMRTKAFIPVEQQIEAATFERGIVVAARATSGTIR